MVTCNYDFTGTPLEGRVKPYVIVRRGGMKIGIIGTTSYLEGVVLKSHLDGIVRLNAIEEVNKWADYLKNRRHCDLVILLSHFGYEGGSVERYAPGKCIGGSHYGNYEGLLPEGNYKECDIDTLGKKSRGAKRLVYSDDGRIYYTEDHFESFTQLY